MDKKITIDNGRYEIVGYFGCWAKSFENNIDKGEVRVIGNKLMYAYSVYKNKFSKNKVNWCAVEDGNNRYSMDDIYKWVNSL